MLSSRALRHVGAAAARWKSSSTRATEAGRKTAAAASAGDASTSTAAADPTVANPVTPDFNTRIDVHNIKLSRPTKSGVKRRPRPKADSVEWTGMAGLEERTKGSLIDETLQEMEKDETFQITAAKLRKVGAKRMSLDERKRRRRALDELGVPDFDSFLAAPPQQQGAAPMTLDRVAATTLQLNIGLYCNQACNHCHVESSPKRREMMDRATAERCLELLAASPSVTTVDITGGAPEMNDQFRYLVEGATAMGKTVLDRCNLTVLVEPGYEDLAEFLAEHRVHVIASLPCYSPKNVNMQRGSGVFDRSIDGLIRLNEVGYGHPEEGDDGLQLDLVYNPLGAFLPPPQEALEQQYKEELLKAFGITFNNLFCFTNMPIKRFADFLYRRGELQEYMELLVNNFNAGAIDGLMCRDHVSVGWNGKIYDCDFNQQLEMGLLKPSAPEETEMTVFDIDSVEDLLEQRIITDNHCFGCTAGMGMS